MANMPPRAALPRAAYADMFGPTTGDRIRLADTSLVIEVVSASTWKYDVSLERTQRGKRQAGKAFGYLVMLRIPEYLVVDPQEEFLAGQVLARRRVGDIIQEWRPDAAGRYL